MAAYDSSQQLSDAELIERCNSGDAVDATHAFNTLYQRHKDYVIRIAMRFGSDPDVALDVLQETFIYLLRKFPPPGPGLNLNAQLTTLLYPVAKNTALTIRRKSEKFKPSEALQPDDLPASVQKTDDSVAVVLEPLSEERREVMMLRFVDDMSLQDIANILEIPLGTVKSRLHLGIKQLRESPDAKKLLIP